MAAHKVEVVVWSVEVGGHHSDVVGAVLKIKAFAHLQAGNFCDSIWLIGPFQRRGEEGIFRDRLRCFARVDASAPEK